MTASSNSKFSSDEKNAKTSTAESRRASKPLMEKRRRARINQSLAILKSLLVDSQKVEGTKQNKTKLEKADILEICVSHLQSVKKSDEQKFMEGFEECFSETTRFLQKSKINSSVVDKLTDHLKKFQQNLDVPTSLTSPIGGTPSTVPSKAEDPTKLLPLSVTLPATSSSDHGDSSSSFPLNVPRFKIEHSVSIAPESTHSSCNSPSLSVSNDSNNNNFISPNNSESTEGSGYHRHMDLSSPQMDSGYSGSAESFTERLHPKIMLSPAAHLHPAPAEAFVLNLSTHNNSYPQRRILQEEMSRNRDEPMDDYCEPLDFSKPLNLCKHPLGYRLAEDGVWRPW